MLLLHLLYIPVNILAICLRERGKTVSGTGEGHVLLDLSGKYKHFDANSVLQLLHRMVLGDVTEIYTASVFRIEYVGW
jgi:hypothetical protein